MPFFCEGAGKVPENTEKRLQKIPYKRLFTGTYRKTEKHKERGKEDYKELLEYNKYNKRDTDILERSSQVADILLVLLIINML